MCETQIKRELHDLAQFEKHDDWTRLRHTCVAGDVGSTDPGRKNNLRPSDLIIREGFSMASVAAVANSYGPGRIRIESLTIDIQYNNILEAKPQGVALSGKLQQKDRCLGFFACQDYWALTEGPA